MCVFSQWNDNPLSTSSSGSVFSTNVKRSFIGTRVFDIKQNHDLFPRVQDRLCSHWVVITSIFPPTTLIRQLEMLYPTWCTVVVGDRKSPKLYNSSVIFLTDAMQESLPYSLIKNLPWNHFGRKNVGFLFAIHHGAKIIYDTDDDNNLLYNEIPNDVNPAENIYISTGHPYLYNPYPAFRSCSSSDEFVFVWQRGFPLDSIQDNRTYAGTLVHGYPGEIVVLQSLADHDPDVDAIYRLTRPLPLQFDGRPKTIALPKGVMSPFNAQAVLFGLQAFWGLFLPVTVHGRVTDIWRSYFVLRILWDLDMTMAFTSPWVEQIRNPHLLAVR